MEVLDKFKKWLDKEGMTPMAFSRLAKLNDRTVYRAYRGLPITKRGAIKKFLVHTKGELTSEDLGYGI